MKRRRAGTNLGCDRFGNPLSPLHFERLYWDDELPVPPHMHLTCEGCGRDLSGVERRVCPDCGKKLHLPIPEEFGLRCPQCEYALTGLTARACPECGTWFDLRELLRARRRRLQDTGFDWARWSRWITAGILGGFGTLMIVTHLGGAGLAIVVWAPLMMLRAAIHVPHSVFFWKFEPWEIDLGAMALLTGFLLAILGVAVLLLF
ncbi:MAG: hypothetical protein JXQ73_00975 [Phycisphaerae bacterium]|nr:hypothetical protein [Phycisphaerae bacterium]